MKFSLLFVLVLLFTFSSSFAQVRGTGVGMSFGEPTAFELKTWTSPTNALDFMVGSSVATEYYRMTFSADYLWHKFDALDTRASFPVYYGIGISAAARSEGPMRYGVRGIVGIMWQNRKFPVDLYIQTAPTVHVSPETSVWLSISAGFRYFFTTER